MAERRGSDFADDGLSRSTPHQVLPARLGRFGAMVRNLTRPTGRVPKRCAGLAYHLGPSIRAWTQKWTQIRNPQGFGPIFK
jgi:hypothetical protein